MLMIVDDIDVDWNSPGVLRARSRRESTDDALPLANFLFPLGCVFRSIWQKTPYGKARFHFSVGWSMSWLLCSHHVWYESDVRHY